MAKSRVSDTPGMPAALKALGIVCLIIALTSALMLALDHFDLARAPGCGPQSGCDRATSSAWGTLPIVNYPTSLVGVAFFAAVLAGWIMCERRVPPIFRAVIWLGGAMSIVFTIAMISGGYVCKYCLATHVANLAFVAVMEVGIRRGMRAPSPRTSPSADRRESDDRRRPRERGTEPPRISAAPSIAAMLTFLIVSGALAIVHVQTESRRAARAEAERRESMVKVARGDSADAGVISTTTQPGEHVKPFTGRWRLGPEDAPIRIVMFFDYQCKDCQQMEAAAMSLVESRKDVSLSVKHFPMNSLCNPQAPNLHPNACWAARAAETAGILRGNGGFWAMHRWLFSQKGSFTDASLPPALQQLGYDAQQFIQTMQSQQTLDVVKADIQEAYDLGLHFTPMIFVNGVELRGFIGNSNALVNAVNALAASNPPPGSASQDQPPRAVQKYVDDWAAGSVRNIPPRSNPHALGPANAKVQIIVWSDYQQPLTAELDRLIREQIKAGRDIRYEFRHYPFDQSCNSGVAQTVHPFGCMASRAAEVAGALGGNDAYWKMHDWLLAHQVALNDDLLREAAQSAGGDPAALLARMNDPAIATIVIQDAQLGRDLVVQGIPTLYVNGKWAPRWKLEGAEILGAIVQQASAP
jgi:protein-disulfide isomerase/uncharacterized membrane protein